MERRRERISGPAAALLCAMALLSKSDLLAQGPYFTASTPISELNSATSNSRWPTLTEDELYILFASDRPGGAGGYDLYESSRSSVDATFSTPTQLAISGQGDDIMPHLACRGLELYFVIRNGTASAIHRASRPNRNAPWGSPVRLGAGVNRLGTANSDPCLTEDGLVLLYARRDSTGRQELARSRRPAKNQPFGTARPVPPAAAVPGDKSSPISFVNGERIYFASQDAAGARKWYASHRDATGWIPAYELPRLAPDTEGSSNGITGRFYAAQLLRNFHLHIRCYKLETVEVEFCIDIDLVPVWCPILMTYIYQNVWEWQIDTVTELVTYTWANFPAVGWFVSSRTLPAPFMIPGISGSLLLDTSSTFFSLGTQPANPTGLTTRPVALPNNPSLVGRRLNVQALHFDPISGSASLSEPGGFLIVQ